MPKLILIIIGFALLAFSYFGWRDVRSLESKRGKRVGSGTFIFWLFAGIVGLASGNTVAIYGSWAFWLGLICIGAGLFR